MPTRLQPTHYCRLCATRLQTSNQSDEFPSDLCLTCSEDSFICANCNAVRPSSTRYISDDQQDAPAPMCRICASRSVILSHTARPTFAPLGSEKPTLGVELEVEGDCNFITTVRNVQRVFPSDFMITKYDGSLSEYGFEICTRPADLPTMKASWSKFFDQRQTLGRLSSFNNNSCGLHVHVSRDGLSEHSIALIVCFVNLAKNRRFIHVCAGRAGNSYTEYHRKNMRDAHLSTGDKYEAINLNHSGTLEFRIFKGTLKRESFYKALEFTECLTRFCSSVFNTRKALAISEFIKYANANIERYPYLCAFINNRWLGKSNGFGLDYWRLCNNAKPPMPPPDLMEGGV